MSISLSTRRAVGGAITRKTERFLKIGKKRSIRIARTSAKEGGAALKFIVGTAKTIGSTVKKVFTREAIKLQNKKDIKEGKLSEVRERNIKLRRKKDRKKGGGVKLKTSSGKTVRVQF